jgi:hypothetical protein
VTLTSAIQKRYRLTLVRHMHYQRKGLNDAASMPNIESIQFFDSIAVVRKRKQLPRYHVMVPSLDGRA